MKGSSSRGKPSKNAFMRTLYEMARQFLHAPEAHCAFDVHLTSSWRGPFQSASNGCSFTLPMQNASCPISQIFGYTSPSGETAARSPIALTTQSPLGSYGLR